MPSTAMSIKFKLDNEGTVLLVRARSSALFASAHPRRFTVVAISGVLFDRLVSRVQERHSVPLYVRVFADGSVIEAISLRQCAFDCFIGDQAGHHLKDALRGGYGGLDEAGGYLFGPKIRLYEGSLPLHECTWGVDYPVSSRLSFAVSNAIIPEAVILFVVLHLLWCICFLLRGLPGRRKGVGAYSFARPDTDGFTLRIHSRIWYTAIVFCPMPRMINKLCWPAAPYVSVLERTFLNDGFDRSSRQKVSRSKVAKLFSAFLRPVRDGRKVPNMDAATMQCMLSFVHPKCQAFVKLVIQTTSGFLPLRSPDRASEVTAKFC